jgi:hypothetical protein
MDAWSNTFSTNETRTGNEITGTSACFFGLTTDTVQFYIKRTGTSSDLTYCRVYDSAGSLQHTFGSIALSGLTTTGSYISFNSGTSYTFADGDRLVMEFTGGDSSNKLNVRKSTTASATDVSGVRFQGSSWASDSLTQCIVGTETPVSTGTRLPPPPLVVHF